MKTNFTKNLKGSTRIMDLIFLLAIAIAYDLVKHIDRKHQTITIIIIKGRYQQQKNVFFRALPE